MDIVDARTRQGHPTSNAERTGEVQIYMEIIMTYQQLETRILLSLAILLVIYIWVIKNHPEWITWIFTYKG